MRLASPSQSSSRYNNVLVDQNTPAIPIVDSAPMPLPSKNNGHFDDVLQRLHKLSISTVSEPRLPLSPLGPAFSLADPSSLQGRDKAAANYAPRPAPAINLSPQSSTSSGSEFGSVSSGRDSFDAFVRTQSRVVRLSDLPPTPHLFLSSVFSQRGLAPTLWISRVPTDQNVWAAFQTHREACVALGLSSPRMSVAAALESDLEPLSKLQRLELGPAENAVPQLYVNPQPNQGLSRVSSVDAAGNAVVHGFGGAPMVPEDFTISSNPPNPRTSFRLGDWICRSQNCAAHNFGYGFLTQPSSPSYNRAQLQQQQQQAVANFASSSPLPSPTANKTIHTHPLLTPSGRAFAVGGKVQNISSDPLSPCIMYWPDNEPFPEQSQIRPGGLMGVQQPPILNTGNRGPISHQPGDWICLKCNYLNWRRRKVCQTCLPYAEGNGDSISAAVQAERIALLTSVLAQTHLASPAPAPAHAQPHAHPGIGRSHSTTPGQTHRPELGSQFAHGGYGQAQNYPIYQTSGQQQHQQAPLSRQHHPSPLSIQRTLPRDGRASPIDLFGPSPLLPSFLQDIVQSPALSPTSTSSADLSFDELEESLPSSTRSSFSGGGPDASPLANIWRLDGEESKSLGAFPLARQELMRGTGSTSSSRNPSLERIRMHISSS
ncbi:RanBP2-type domain-containing protein [Mycena sanguinolenta]|uniref:RanBP2-type domain-containing protein n=1 Tax=Mycena sanguinolenta TaxID=230812 RepID=A0A8H7DHI9_9AGAR|nr:RanBP2-type domain-containing protein [Mycena sanguinolenta]